MNLILEGIEKKLILFDEEQKFITYLHQNKKRNYTNPEEQIQAETYLKLVLIYGYSPQKIKQFVTVTMGASTKEADIIVYNDDQLQSPHIVVECKKQEVSELEFKQAIEQGFSYAVAEGARYVWVTSGIKNDYYLVPTEKPKARQSIPDIPQFGVTKLAKFKYAKNGGESNGQKLFELEIVSEDDLTRRFKQAHNALWGGGELNPSTAFDELDKLIFCKIWDEKKARKKGDAYDFQIFSEDSEEKTNLELINRIKSLYHEGRKKDPEVFKDDIRLTAEKLRTVVGYLEGINLGATDLDSKGRAFETFMGSFFRGDFGQYFTPRNIVKFIVDVLPITNDSLVLDTSCGSGGFLLHVLDKIRKLASQYYDQNSVEHYRYWHDFAEKNLFGIEINEQIARTAKMNMIIHDDGHTNVIAADGLLSSQDIINKTNNHGFSYNKFDFIVTNPPFGSTVKLTEQAYMKNYNFAKKEVDWLNPNTRQSERDNQNTEILFIEQCYNFLREDGYLAIVIPDGILTNSSLQYVRDGIEERFRIVAVISLPQTAFTATGAGVKSSVLFLRKYPLAVTEKIQQDKLFLQDSLKVKHNFDQLLTKLDKEKKEKIKKLIGFDNVDNLEGKALSNCEAFKEWKKEVNNEYREKIDAIKESLLDEYLTAKSTLIKDYDIFMGIAEDIGYDATGKVTNNNELDFITVELSRFIECIERGEDSFFLAKNVDKNKLFLVKLSQLEERFDSFYYKSDFQALTKKLKKINAESLSKIGIEIRKGVFDLSPNYYKQSGIPFLRVSDIKEGTIIFDNTVYITEEKHQQELYTEYLSGDLVISKVGTIGEVSILPSIYPKYNISQNVVGLKLKPNLKYQILSKFLQICLTSNFGIMQFNRQFTTGVQPKITLDAIRKIMIPIPPLEIQQQIVAIIDNAYKAKKEKEKEAEKLLNSIDDYLLNQLGIELPKQEENTVKSRMFVRKLSDISGSRFDPNYQSKINLINSNKGNYPVKQLKDLIKESPQYGANESAIDFSSIYDTRYIRITDIDDLGNLKQEDWKTAEKIEDKYILNQDDLLFARSGSVGRCYIHQNNKHKSIFAGYLIRSVIDKSKANSYYIFYYCHSIIYKTWVNAIQRSAVQSNINSEEYKSLPVILPPIEKQNEIAENITKIREKAKQLKEEAKRGLEEAKIEIERMILG